MVAARSPIFFNGTQVATTLEQCIGNTPLIKLQRMAPGGGGEIAPGDILIEATSGNTGIALAMIAALKVSPETADA